MKKKIIKSRKSTTRSQTRTYKTYTGKKSILSIPYFNFKDNYIRHLKHIFTFNAVEGRKAYFMFLLVNTLVLFVLKSFLKVIFVSGLNFSLLYLLFLLDIVFYFLDLTATMRRFRDAGFNPYLVFLGLLSFIPIFGGIFTYLILIFILFVTVQPSKRIGNSYI